MPQTFDEHVQERLAELLPWWLTHCFACGAVNHEGRCAEKSPPQVLTGIASAVH